MNPFRTVNPFKKFVVPRPKPKELELADEASHLHIDPNGGEIVDDRPRAFNNYDDIPF